MSRPVALGAGALALALLIVAALLLSSGGDDEQSPATPPPAAVAPGEGPAPGGLGALPPGFVECMAQEGYDVASSADIHSAPPDVLQACFGAAH